MTNDTIDTKALNYVLTKFAEEYGSASTTTTVATTTGTSSNQCLIRVDAEHNFPSVQFDDYLDVLEDLRKYFKKNKIEILGRWFSAPDRPFINSIWLVEWADDSEYAAFTEVLDTFGGHVRISIARLAEDMSDW